MEGIGDNRCITYEDAGVSIKEAERLVGWLKGKNKQIGSFSVKVKVGNSTVLLSADGVGTKILLYLKAGRFKGLGQDLVAMVSNDILADGGRMVYFLDYYATFPLKGEVAKEVLSDVIESCKKIGAKLVGGETAELPGIIVKDTFDIAGFGVGVPLKKRFQRVKSGDAIIGFPSSGFHSNGYSLIRKVLEEKGLDPFKVYPEIHPQKPLIDILLTPTRLYHKEGKEMFLKFGAKRGAHITGGGIPENLPRALEGNKAKIYWENIPTPEYMKAFIRMGNIPEDEAKRVFNMGVGFAFIVPRKRVDEILHRFKGAFILGEVL
ncbi:MAG: phosphoribosylformylglycinamidine cyclo-ligase [candidate division WOR-3 bacterium]